MGFLSVIKAAWGFIKLYKWIMIAISAIGMLWGVYSWIQNNGERKVELAQCQSNSKAYEGEVERLNDRIRGMNVIRLQEIADHEKRLTEFKKQAIEAAKARDMITVELSEVRRKTREAIQNDEDFKTWADIPVPDAGVRLLRQSATGTQ